MLDARVGRRGDEGGQPLLAGGILRVVEAELQQRSLQRLDVLLGLRHPCFVDLADDRGHDHRGEQADDDHDDHDLDEGEATRGAARSGPVNLNVRSAVHWHRFRA